MYESNPSYSTVYDDGKVYIDLGAIRFEGEFDNEDKKWHDSFYNAISVAKASISPIISVESAKTQAIAALNNIIPSTFVPSDIWKTLIAEAVDDYIQIQGNQFRQIIMDSNMYPIQWSELPQKIDQKAFDYALTALLYAIKQRLITNVTILVDGGKVKCYSCVDASTIIKKIIDRNVIIWNNQIKFAKSDVNKAETTADVLKAFDMIEAYDKTRSILNTLLIKQSRLYASYIDQLIEVQIIKDNDTEVML